MRQTTHVTGIRRARYLGLHKTTLEHNPGRDGDQPHPLRRLAHRKAPGQDTDHTPTKDLHQRRMNSNLATGSGNTHRCCATRVVQVIGYVMSLALAAAQVEKAGGGGHRRRVR